ncbi:MAG TPA: acyltransferase [Thermoanaerobaculia bacterium]|nr:acyltransferase [Thermoanaerobaculia bacterium]
MPPRPHFPGLDSLRFWAALLVVVGHVPMTQAGVGLPSFAWGALFFRGGTAVSFFFTLSGFLITYLLLDEQARTGRIDVGAFYLRRVLRIWPLYFATIGFGLFFYNFLLPRLGIERAVTYPLGLAVLLYVFFLPNLMNALYSVGGILNPTWSIGVEEQFYLAWAPLVRRFRERLPALCGWVLVGSFAVFLIATANPWGWAAMQKFWTQLKFHFMAAGALAAWALFHHRERLLALPVFRKRWLQVGLGIFLLQYLVANLVRMHWAVDEVVQLLLFPWLLLEVGANPARALRVANPVTEWLGEISYGLYMLHMVAVYAVARLYQATGWWQMSFPLYALSFQLLAIGSTILLAWLSHRLYERPILGLKRYFSR